MPLEFEISPEAKTFISNIQGPFGVLIIAGKYRSGKSLLINKVILEQQDGFGVGDTVNACTQGLNVWNQVI
jgi:hypothetical protein